MELSEKLQRLRKQNNLTQEQLAEKLFVSRTAVSKWESGRGCPNIDSLLGIARLYGISVDGLLSGEELINIAGAEKRSDIKKSFWLFCGILDVLTVLCIFLPFFGNRESNHIVAVSLFGYNGVSNIIKTFYFIMLSVLSVLGAAEIIFGVLSNDKNFKVINLSAYILHSASVLLFIASNQPYAAAYLFALFIAKIIVNFKSFKLQKRC